MSSFFNINLKIWNYLKSVYFGFKNQPFRYLKILTAQTGSD